MSAPLRGDMVVRERARERRRARRQDAEAPPAAAARRWLALERALEALGTERDAARRAGEARVRELRTVSHELRTPLHVLRLHLALMERREGLLPEAVRESLRGAVSAWGELSDLVESLLGYCRFLSSDAPEQSPPAEADLCPAVRSAVRGLRILARRKGLHLGLRIARGLPLVPADPQLVHRIAVNLVENAIKYTPSGAVTAVLHRRGRTVELRVDDTGPGIPEESQERIFAPFERLPSGELRGVGLGLWLVREMAARLGGVVQVHSTPGQGSSFRLALPLEVRRPAEG